MKCAVCGSSQFSHSDVLWHDLITTWELKPHEVTYINRQQGTRCNSCRNPLRSVGLAFAVVQHYQFSGTLAEFCRQRTDLRVLEINTAGNLTPVLKTFPHHRLVEYPEFDMQNLNLPSDTYDLVLHSDTLEHVPDPIQALRECYRVLKPGGVCAFTVPIVVDRLTRNRKGLPGSYHGSNRTKGHDLLVHTEFGMDFWKTVIAAGFNHCALSVFEYPAVLSILATKNSNDK
jgi:SAM-dependent methyltransferase